MSTNSNGRIGTKTDTRVMYVGSDRFKALTDAAIEVSYKGKRQITASQMAKYTVDHYLQEAKEKLLKEIQES
jgi:hypothetical protein